MASHVMGSERARSVPALAEHIFLRVGRALDSTDYTRNVTSGRKAKPVPTPFGISPALHFIAAPKPAYAQKPLMPIG
ncbi:hypothetical protein CABS01_05115 [Colletotrichum abscissum]|uniref:uncharacterized protein n=1 Tax=Colletotrichum abscissum TaxID=1671311 RepID=UPI0027D640A5|nr:uncharacterized protein CABS01_05115 [Colletotrichum abscissum]KAK1523494.1 hypothetical protein CABS01_05115 [Colletotrichum abscissum]